MSQKRTHLKTVNLLVILALFVSLPLAGCQGQLGLNVDLDQGADGQGGAGLSDQILALVLVLLITVVIVAIVRR